MQKKLIALAIAAAASGAAFAQTNVTIYGIADVGYVGVDPNTHKFHHIQQPKNKTKTHNSKHRPQKIMPLPS